MSIDYQRLAKVAANVIRASPGWLKRGGSVREVRHFKGRRYVTHLKYEWKSLLDPRPRH